LETDGGRGADTAVTVPGGGDGPPGESVEFEGSRLDSDCGGTGMGSCVGGGGFSGKAWTADEKNTEIMRNAASAANPLNNGGDNIRELTMLDFGIVDRGSDAACTPAPQSQARTCRLYDACVECSLLSGHWR